jgi:hypothetical protein
MDNTVEFLQFHKLLEALEKSDVLIRLRPSGERWMEYSKVILVSDNAAIVEENGKRRVIMNLKSIVEFALDTTHSEYAENMAYQIARG